MSNSPEYNLESFAIAAAQASGVVPQTLQLRHHDDGGDADTERIFFEATTGNQDPPDSQVYEMQLLIEFRSTNRDATETDPIFAGIIKAMVLPAVGIVGRELFPGGLWMDQEQSEDARNDSADTRSRSRTYNFHAGQS